MSLKQIKKKPQNTYVFLKQIWEHSMHHVQREHESVGLEERAAHVLVHQPLQGTVQHLYPVLWTRSFL